MITNIEPVYQSDDNNIQIFRDCLNTNILNDLNNFIHGCIKNNIYSHTNIDSWDVDIIDKSKEIYIISLNNDYPDLFKKLSRRLFLKYKIPTEGLHLNIHIMSKDCYINDHNDSHVNYAFTIYLNDKWEFDNGGIFQYIIDGVTYSILPEINKMVILRNTLHRVTKINKNITRITLQGFYGDTFTYKGKNINNLCF